VIDGLALPAFEGLLPSPTTRVVALIHHPLALETGIDVAQQRRFAELEPRLATACVGVIVTSPATVASILAMGVARSRIAVVEPAVSRAVLRRRAAGQRLHLLCVASLTQRKAHRVLIAALGRLRGYAWRLTAIGPRDLDRREAGRVALAIASRGLRGRVRLAGACAPETVRTAYAKADLFVLPSLYEGYGMAFAEAIASGLPVIGARAGAVPTTVPPRAGILVRPGRQRGPGARAAATVRPRRCAPPPASAAPSRSGARLSGLAAGNPARFAVCRSTEFAALSGFTSEWLAVARGLRRAGARRALANAFLSDIPTGGAGRRSRRRRRLEHRLPARARRRRRCAGDMSMRTRR
jgi:hypothetical protein